MYIGFFGDSYCACKNNDGSGRISWPVTAASLLDSEVGRFCKGGTNAYYALQRLREHINEVDYAVVVVSHPYRLPTEMGTPITPAGFDKIQAVTHYGEEIANKLEVTTETYYKIFSSEFHELGQRGVLQEIDKIFKEHDKPGFVVPAFPEALCGYRFKHVDWTDWDLKVGFRLIDRYLNFGYDYVHIERGGTFSNHFSPHGNLLLGHVIADIISSYKHPRYIDMKVQLAKSASKPRRPKEELDIEYQKKFKALGKKDPSSFKII